MARPALAADQPEPLLRPAPFARWGLSLTTRILVVNIVVLGLMAFSLLYLDSYRRQLLAERFERHRDEAQIAALAISRAQPWQVDRLMAEIGTRQHMRLRLYDSHGQLVIDSFHLAGVRPSFTLADPTHDALFARTARMLDRGMDALLGAPPVAPYAEPARDTASAWPEIRQALGENAIVVRERYAPNRTPIITAAAPIPTTEAGAPPTGWTLLTLNNDTDITQRVRDERQTLANLVAMALLLTIFLSLFLARTIVQPLRLLVRAAIRVRLGRDRTVVVPRLPERRDEIGLLARAFSDMTAALRHRIDAVESFAADVAHEIKNPLASLRSALESLDKVEDSELRRQLAAIANHDVQRIDRLITEIAEASRIDAELSRIPFEPVDLAALAQALVTERERRGANGGHAVKLHRVGPGPFAVAGDPARLERVFENLLDNAVSFSPPGGAIGIVLDADDGRVRAEVVDAGPGIAPEARESVFERFHSLRPAGEDFGSHSGLGLAIARTIIEAHDGRLTAADPVAPPDPAMPGARLVIDLPALRPPSVG